MFHAADGLFFERLPNGNVRIEKRDGNGVTVFEQEVSDGIWCSAVLSMTAHSERPGDWVKFMAHHAGDHDILTPFQATGKSTGTSTGTSEE